MSREKKPLYLEKVNSINDFHHLINIIQINLRRCFFNNIVKNPFELIWIDPKKITNVFPQFSPTEKKNYRNLIWFNSKYFSSLINIGLIKDGKWDKIGKNFEDLDVFKAFKKRFQQNEPWKNTSFYYRVKRNIEEEGKTKWGCNTVKEFEERLISLENLYEEIKNQGYKSQKELENMKIYDEIKLGITRNGKILFLDGQHRLAMAKLLELNEVPTLVYVWHKNFIEKIKEIYPTKNLTPKFLSRFFIEEE